MGFTFFPQFSPPPHWVGGVSERAAAWCLVNGWGWTTTILNKCEEIKIWPHFLCYYFVLIILLMRPTESTLMSCTIFISSCFTSDSRWGYVTDRSMAITYGGLTSHLSLIVIVTDQSQSLNKQCSVRSYMANWKVNRESVAGHKVLQGP